MRALLGPILIVVGVVLLIFGFQASDSLASDFSRFFTGNPTDRSMWLIAGGTVAIVAGICTAVFWREPKRA